MPCMDLTAFRVRTIMSCVMASAEVAELTDLLACGATRSSLWHTTGKAGLSSSFRPKLPEAAAFQCPQRVLPRIEAVVLGGLSCLELTIPQSFFVHGPLFASCGVELCQDLVCQPVLCSGHIAK